ncbi:MAG: hypothetical protein KDA31_09130 [Phycisphaerales bacterium]|nr:hypothetical protein [Phycisphaerales bacterium]
MSLSTLIRVVAIASLLVVPVSCIVSTGVVGSLADDGGRVTMNPERKTVKIDTEFETLGGLHKVERVSAWFVHEDGTKTLLAADSPSSTDWGPVITTEILTKYGIPLTDGQKDAEIVIACSVTDPPPPTGADGELLIRGQVRLPYVPEGSKDEFMEQVQPFEHTMLVRVGGKGVPSTKTERVNGWMGMIMIGSLLLVVVLTCLNGFWPKVPGDPRTKEQLIEIGVSGEALPKGVTS